MYVKCKKMHLVAHRGKPVHCSLTELKCKLRKLVYLCSSQDSLERNRLIEYVDLLEQLSS